MLLPRDPAMTARALPLAASAALLAGCLAGTPLFPFGDRSVIPTFPQEHDHRDPALHEAGDGLDVVGYHNLVPGTDGADAAARGGKWLGSEIIVRGDHAYVGYLGAPWLLAIVNVSDSVAPRMEGVLEANGAWTVDVAVSDDGDWAFLSLYNGAAVGTLFARDYVLRTDPVPTGPATGGVLVVDARDRARPSISSFFPFYGLGPHTAFYHRYPDGREVVFANKADPVPGNGVALLEVVAAPGGGRALEPRGFFALPEELGPFAFPHDGEAQEHPVTGRTLAYLAYSEPGLTIVDVTDPTRPALVSVFRDYTSGAEQGIVHDAHPVPGLVGGRHYAMTAPEIVTGGATGKLRVYDTTDPAAPTLVGEWTMPGEYVVDEAFNFSPHNFVLTPDARVALAHGHAGVWVLDWLGRGGRDAPDPERIASPIAVAYRATAPPTVAPVEWSPVGGVPWVWGTAIGPDGTVWASDVASGLVGLRMT